MTHTPDFDPLLADQPAGLARGDSERVFSLCVGLGRATEPLLAALRQHDRRNFAVDGLFVQSGTKPSVLEAWSSATPIEPPDILVLVIDADDPHAVDLSQFWAVRLAELKVSLGPCSAHQRAGNPSLAPDAAHHIDAWRTAIIVGHPSFATSASLADALNGNFDAVIQLLPQRRILQQLAMFHLTLGLLFLNRSLICHDGEDLHRVLTAGSYVRAAATLWNHPDRERQAVERLWKKLQPKHPKGAMAFLSTSYAEANLGDFSRLSDDLMSRLPEDALGFAVTHWQHGLRTGRRVLAVALAEDRVFSW
jgi:hypothetical protein